jgi:predicted  nucleic acid-binding Zn-ribbon protein
MRYGNRTEAAQFGDPDAMLARFEPGPERVARLVLHPRLTFVPCASQDLDAFAATFAVDVPARIFLASDLEGASAGGDLNADLAATLDEAIEGILSAREQQDAISRRLSDAQERLDEARVGLERVATQRAQVEAAVSDARERLTFLEHARSEAELRDELEAARSEAADAEKALTAATARASDDPPELREARAAVEKTRHALQRIENAGVRGGYALDEASHQLELWAAQRAEEMARFELERLQRRSGDADAQAAVEVARERVQDAHERVARAERELAAWSQSGVPDDPAREAAAIRAQIEAVQRSLGDAEAAREAEVTVLDQETETAQRDLEAIERQLERSLDRVETDVDGGDVDGVLAELRHRREQLTAGDDGLSPVGRVLRDLAVDAPEPLLVFVAPVAEPGVDLVGALISVSGLKRTVVVTDKTEMLHEARELDPALGAVREPLETGGTSRQELARSDGNRT